MIFLKAVNLINAKILISRVTITQKIIYIPKCNVIDIFLYC